MAFLPSKDTKFSGTEKLTNLTALSGGAIDLAAAATVTVPTAASPSGATTKAQMETADNLRLALTGGALTGPVTLGPGSGATGLDITTLGNGKSLIARLAANGDTGLYVESVGAASNIIESRVTGAASSAFTVSPTGALSWGPGTAGVDTTFYRTAPGVLFTPGKLQTQGVPSSYDDVVNKGTLDAALASAIAGVDFKGSVKAASASMVGCSARSNTTLTIGGTTYSLDGVTLANNDRVLVKDSTSGAGNGPADNGLYYVSGIGSNVVLIRTTDSDTWAELPGSIVVVEQGTLNADKAFMITADQGGTLGTTSVSIVPFGAGQVYTAGSGLSLSSNSFLIDTAVTMALAGAQTVTGTKTFQQASALADAAVFKVTADTYASLAISPGGKLTFVDPATSSIRGTIAGSASGVSFTGTNDFTGGVAKVATSAPTTSDTSAASTAFVQRASRASTMVVVTDASFPYTVSVTAFLASADVVVCKQTAAGRAVTLCAASAISAGTSITIKDASAAGALTYPITVNRAGTDTIDGLTSDTIDNTSEARTYVSDGVSAWYRL